MTQARAQRFVDLLRSLQPNTLIDGRLGMAGDYVTTGDNVIPPDVQGEAWEVPATLNHTWGYRTDDHDWKSPQTVIFKLIDIVSKGGNYLLNVGPMADGVIPQPSQDVLRTVGRWLRVNGEAVYGAGATPFGDELGEPSAKGATNVRGEPLFLQNTQWRYTTKPGKLYVTFFDEPRAPFAMPAMKNRITRAYHLDGGAEVKIDGRKRPHAPASRSPDPQSDGHGGRRGVRGSEDRQMTRRELLQLAASAPVLAFGARFDGSRSTGGLDRDCIGARAMARRRRRDGAAAPATVQLTRDVERRVLPARIRNTRRGAGRAQGGRAVRDRARDAGRHAALRRRLSDAQPDRRHARRHQPISATTPTPSTTGCPSRRARASSTTC